MVEKYFPFLFKKVCLSLLQIHINIREKKTQSKERILFWKTQCIYIVGIFTYERIIRTWRVCVFTTSISTRGNVYGKMIFLFLRDSKKYFSVLGGLNFCIFFSPGKRTFIDSGM